MQLHLLLALVLSCHRATAGRSGNRNKQHRKVTDKAQDLRLSTDAEANLIADLFRQYQKFTPPHANLSAKGQALRPVVVQLGMQYVLLVKLDELRQEMQSNVWLTMGWTDVRLKWNPADYSHIPSVRVPCDKIWLPDIVLSNNVDGGYEPTFYSNVIIRHDGRVTWVPPALFRSSCIMDVEHFPFDTQHCPFYFSSWTYDATEVQLEYFNSIEGMDLREYSFSTIWDVMDCPATIIDRNEMEFVIVLRRKGLFYTIVLIVPSVLMAAIAVITFYLPTDAGEKIGLSILNLLSVVFVLNLLAKILPSTSNSVPLLAKYLLMIFILNCLVIFISVCVVNVHFRSSRTHNMSHATEYVLLSLLPTLLVMHHANRKLKEECSMFREDVQPTARQGMSPEIKIKHPVRNDDTFNHHPLCRRKVHNIMAKKYGGGAISPTDAVKEAAKMSNDMRLAVDKLTSITRSVTNRKTDGQIKDEWKMIALVLDRLLLYVFSGVTIGGTVGLFLTVPNMSQSIDQQHEITRLAEKYSWYSGLMKAIIRN